MRRVDVLHGPNLGRLGERSPQLYGRQSLESIEAALTPLAAELEMTMRWRQSNHEGQLIDWLEESRRCSAAVIINAGGLTHTSVSLRDALEGFKAPLIEVHLTIPEARESFRHVSLLSTVVDGRICGLGATGYELALRAVAALWRGKEDKSHGG